jgi:hypothetical protein
MLKRVASTDIEKKFNIAHITTYWQIPFVSCICFLFSALFLVGLLLGAGSGALLYY